MKKWLLEQIQQINEGFREVTNMWITGGESADEVNYYVGRFKRLRALNLLRDQSENMKNIEWWGKNHGFEAFKRYVINREEWAEGKVPLKKKAVMGKDIAKVFENDKAVIFYAKTKAGMCRLGSDSDWCVAKEGQTHYESYTGGGNRFFVMVIKDDYINRMPYIVYKSDDGGEIYWYDEMYCDGCGQEETRRERYIEDYEDDWREEILEEIIGENEDDWIQELKQEIERELSENLSGDEEIDEDELEEEFDNRWDRFRQRKIDAAETYDEIEQRLRMKIDFLDEDEYMDGCSCEAGESEEEVENAKKFTLVVRDFRDVWEVVEIYELRDHMLTHESLRSLLKFVGIESNDEIFQIPEEEGGELDA